jgi:hypothetical protein
VSPPTPRRFLVQATNVAKRPPPNENSSKKSGIDGKQNPFDSLLPRSGMGADRVTEALERNLAEVFELESFAEA